VLAIDGGADVTVSNLNVTALGSAITDCTNEMFGVYVLGGATYHVHNNLVQGGGIGVALVTDSAAYGHAIGSVTAKLHGNTITHAGVGILLSDTNTTDTFVPVLTAHNNAIQQNSTAGLQTRRHRFRMCGTTTGAVPAAQPTPRIPALPGKGQLRAAKQG
jgi:hypothetical protein